MINNEITMSHNNNENANPYAGLLSQGKDNNSAAYRHMRARFLQQSAQYLGADLRDRKVLSLCFSDYPFNSAVTEKQ
jgi:hypothetical protein